MNPKELARLPAYIRGQLEHDRRKFVKLKARIGVLADRKSEILTELGQINNEITSIQTSCNALETKTYDLTDHITDARTASASRREFKRRMLERWIQGAEGVRLLSSRVASTESEDPSDVTTSPRLVLELSIRGQQLLSSFIDKDHEDAAYALMGRLYRMGVCCETSARFEISARWSEQKQDWMLEHIASKRNWTPDDFEQGSLPVPHYYQYSCLGEWSQYVYDLTLTLRQQLQMLITSATAINYEESAQMPYLAATDLNLLSPWYVATDDRYLKCDTLAEALSHVSTDRLISLCLSCGSNHERIMGKFYEVNPLTRDYAIVSSCPIGELIAADPDPVKASIGRIRNSRDQDNDQDEDEPVTDDGRFVDPTDMEAVMEDTFNHLVEGIATDQLEVADINADTIMQADERTLLQWEAQAEAARELHE